jgi:hypothetical protein
METKLIARLKVRVLALDCSCGVPRTQYEDTLSAVRKFMGPDAAMVLSDALENDSEVEGGSFYFPHDGDALKVWKRMLHAYKVEHSLDNDENITEL